MNSKYVANIATSTQLRKEEAKRIVPTHLISWALQHNHVRELQLYLYLRQSFAASGGYFTVSALKQAQHHFKKSESTIGRWFKNLKKHDLVRKIDGYYHFRSMRKLIVSLPNEKSSTIQSSAAAELTIPINSDYIIFKAWLLEAYKAKNIQYRNRYYTLMQTTVCMRTKAKVRRSSFTPRHNAIIGKRKDELSYNQGCFSYGLVYSNLGIAKSTSSKLKKVAQHHEFAKYERQFVEGISIPTNELTSFVEGMKFETGKNVRPFMKQRENGFWGMISCDLITTYIPIVRHKYEF